MRVKTGGRFRRKREDRLHLRLPIIHNKTAVSMTGVPSMAIQGFKVVRFAYPTYIHVNNLASGL